MSEIVFYTQAYNAAKTIERTIKSVLGQTEENWIWHLVENGSKDATRKIIKKYAALDKRIITEYIDTNDPKLWINRYFAEIFEKYDDDCYFVFLDADDEYKPDFLKSSLKFMLENSLDIVCCGSDFVDVRTGKQIGQRCLSQDILISGEGFGGYFPMYHAIIRPVWGKVFRFKVVKNCNLNILKEMSYGCDTIFCLQAFLNSSRVGIMAKSLHKYYISPASSSYKFDSLRIVSDQMQYDLTEEYLERKVGLISPRNRDFLEAVYMNAIKDTFAILLRSDLDVAGKLDGIDQIIADSHTVSFVLNESFGVHIGNTENLRAQRKKVFSDVLDWLLALNDVPDEYIEQFCKSGELLAAFTQRQQEWVYFKKLRVHFFIDQLRFSEASIGLDELSELFAEAD